MGTSARADSCKAKRLEAGLTISELAHKANVSDRTIQILEDGGTASQDVVQRIADALGISLAAIGKSDL